MSYTLEMGGVAVGVAPTEDAALDSADALARLTGKPVDVIGDRDYGTRVFPDGTCDLYLPELV